MIARHLKQAGLALLMLSSFSMLQSAYAAGTTAGTTISNTATVNYSVASVAQAPIASNAAEFVVDSRVDFSIARDDSAPITARPNQTGVVATFTLSNDGNSVQSYQLQATNITTAVFGNNDTVADDLVLTTAWDSNGNGVYDAGDATGNPGDIVPATGSGSTTVRVFVLATIPATAANGQFASINLAVRAATAGSNGATLEVEDNGPDVAMAAQVVFADAGEDNLETVDSQYVIESAALTVTKSVTVISDPLNNTSNPKAIPGAIVEYSIAIQNTGSVAADTLTMTDTVPASTTYVADTLQLDGSAAGTVSGSNISVPIPTLAPTATATITFRVEIQ